MRAFAFRDPLFAGTVKRNCIELALERARLARGIEDAVVIFVDSRDFVYFPISASQLFLQIAVRAVEIKMTKTVALTGPKKPVAVFEEIQIAFDVDPGRVLFM